MSDHMSLTEKLRNPQRDKDGRLTDAINLAAMTEAADEIEIAHGRLDYYGVPRSAPDGTPYSLLSRITMKR